MLAIETDRPTKRFGRTLAVDDLSLTVAAGEVFGFLGPTGAGKSTTIRLLLGMIRPSAGTARVFGDDASDVAGTRGRRRHRGRPCASRPSRRSSSTTTAPASVSSGRSSW